MSSALIVDDVAHMRQLLVSILEDIGLDQIYEASSGEEALRTLSSHDDIELVVLDFVLDDMTGIEIAKKMATDMPDREFKICFVTGKRDQESVRKTILAGASDCILKPVDPVIVVEKIKKILGMPTDGGLSLKTDLPAELRGSPFEVPLKITLLSEHHIEFVAPMPFKAKSSIELVVPAFRAEHNRLGQLHIIVEECRDATGGFCVRGSLNGLSEPARAELRSILIHQKQFSASA